MVLVETLFDFISASVGAIAGAVVTHLMTRSKSRNMSNQLVVSRQALEKIKLENENLLKSIHEKENLILKMQVEILGDKANNANPKKSPKKK